MSFDPDLMNLLKGIHRRIKAERKLILESSGSNSASLRSVDAMKAAVDRALRFLGRSAVGLSDEVPLATHIADMLTAISGLCASQVDGPGTWNAEEVFKTVERWDGQTIRTAVRVADAILASRALIGRALDFSDVRELTDLLAGQTTFKPDEFVKVVCLVVTASVPTAEAVAAVKTLSALGLVAKVRRVTRWSTGSAPLLEALCKRAMPRDAEDLDEYLSAEPWALELVLKSDTPQEGSAAVRFLLGDIRHASLRSPDGFREFAQKQSEDFDLRTVISAVRRFGWQKALTVLDTVRKEGLLQKRSPSGKILIVEDIGLRPLHPDAILTVAEAGQDQRAAGIFFRGGDKPTRQLVDVAVVSAYHQLHKYGTTVLVPGLGIVVSDPQQAKADADLYSSGGRITRSELIQAYRQVLSKHGTGCLSGALREFADRIASGIISAKLRGTMFAKLMQVVYQDDLLRKIIFESETTGLGESIHELPELVDASPRTLAGILMAENLLGPLSVASVVRSRLKTVNGEREALLRQGKSVEQCPSVKAVAEELSKLLQDVTTFTDREDAELALSVISNAARKSSESWALMEKVLVALRLLLSTAVSEESRQDIASARPEAILVMAEAILKKDPFETYKDKITPDEIQRWHAALENPKPPLLPLGVEVRVVVNGRELTGLFLERRDKRGIMLGEITDCCQCPRGAGKLAAWFGHEDPRAGYFVVLNAQGMVLCMSMVWVDTQTNTVVFDNIEHNRFYGDNDKAIDLSIPAYQQMAELLVTKYNFSRIQCGCEHSDWVKKTWEPAEQPIPISPCSYTDAKEQVDLLRPIKK